jgi:leucyl aminopeptidase
VSLTFNVVSIHVCFVFVGICFQSIHFDKQLSVSFIGSPHSLLLSTMTSESNHPFSTWTFDKANAAMEWNSLSSVTLKVDTYSNGNSNNDGDTTIAETSPALSSDDLVLVGICIETVPASTESTTPSTTEEDTQRLAWTDVSRSIDASLWEGALTEVATEMTIASLAPVGTASPWVRGPQRSSSGATQHYALVSCGPLPNNDDATASAPSVHRLGAILGTTLATQAALKKNITTVSLILPDSVTLDATFWKDMSTALHVGLYADNRYKTGKNIKKLAEHLQTVTVYTTTVTTAVDETAVQKSIEQGHQLAQGVYLTRDVVNAPHNILNSESLAETAQRIANESNGTITCTILDKHACEERGMGAYLGVARGSETEPQFIHLTYTPPSSSNDSSSAALKKVALVGKGLLFDTGGYNIKMQMMELMKFDCGGAAAVLGAARAVSALQPPGVEAHFIVAACENMINEKAMVPGDILRASNGKTIEVMNTDAEGRLTLADALVYADKEVGAESIVELSTLTGACIVSLGKAMAGVWTSNDALAAEIANVSHVTGDKSWRMPLVDEYKEQIQSPIADLQNIGGKWNGSITAALFLQHFVDPTKPFAHIDIAGPVWDDKKQAATGYGCKLVTEWITRQGAVEKE